MSDSDLFLIEEQQRQSGPSHSPRRLVSPPPSLHRNPSGSTKTRPPHHRLGFTSDLPRGPPPEYNADGSPSLEYIAYQSTCQLKSRWDSILDRYSDARHDDDELMFGGGKDAVPRLVKDSGMLRKLASGAEFGSFYLRDEDMVEMLERLKRAAALPCAEDDADQGETDELDEWSAAFFKSQFVNRRSEEEEEQGKASEAFSKPIDPDLQEFLLAEQKRREICGDQDDEDDAYESDSDAAFVSYDSRAPSPARQHGQLHRSPPAAASTSTLYLAGPGTYSTSDDDLDVLDEDELDEYDLMMMDKRRHVEQMVAGWSKQDSQFADDTEFQAASQTVDLVIPQVVETPREESTGQATISASPPPEGSPDESSLQQNDLPAQVDSRSPTPSAIPPQRPAPQYRSRLLNHSLLRRQRLSLGQSVAEVG